MSKSNPTPGKAPASRRQRSRVPGIYFRDAKARRVYEFTYRDGTGRQRWVSGFSTLKEAEQARADVMRRVRRGERVVPIKSTFAEFAASWLETQAHLRASTRDRYEWAIRVHLVPRFGRFKLAEVNEDHVALLMADMSKTHAPATAKAVFNVLSLIMGRAVRRGAIPANPCAGLERSERPKGRQREMRVLDREQITALIDASKPQHRALLAALVFCGLRVSEALALRWHDVDLDAGRIKVRWQINPKTRERDDLKTDNGRREVVVMPALVKVLAEHRLASPFSQDSDPVFASAVGTVMSRDNVRNRILRPAVAAAGLDRADLPRLRTHDLRHTFASLLIAGGASVVFVAKQMGHSNPAVTLSTYAHLFDAREHADKMAAQMEASFGATLTRVV